jgi:hypothetical protein
MAPHAPLMLSVAVKIEVEAFPVGMVFCKGVTALKSSVIAQANKQLQGRY